jgi:serine/threonine protein kinase, bacterial
MKIAMMNLNKDLHPGYRLRRLRGVGGYGEVWEAENVDGSAVALKFTYCTRGQGAAHELRSIQLIKEFSHPNLVRIDKVWCAGDYLVIAMELADGSLGDLLDVYREDVGAAFPAHHLLPLLSQVAAALDFLNNRQHVMGGQRFTIQHCDVTPRNMLLFGSTVKLSDFGLTTTLATDKKLHYRAGTPDFAAPEVFQGQVTHRTDQYALAVCYCFLHGGRLPFADTPPNFQVEYIRPAPDLSMLEPNEGRVISRALATLPHERWPSCQELIAELQKATCLPAAANPAFRGESRREPRHEPERRVDCQVLATLGNVAWTVDVQNLSQCGARLRITKPGCVLQAGRLLELVLAPHAGGKGVRVNLRLAHSKEKEDGDYEVGGAFLQPLSQVQLSELTRAN